MNYIKIYKQLSYHTAQVLLSVLAIVAAVLLTACGQQAASSTADYIGIDAAKESALKAADISAGQATILSAEMDKKNETFYYKIIFQENDMKYEYDIDALTGVVIEEKHTAIQSESLVDADKETGKTALQKNTANSSAPAAKIDSEAAFSIALSHAGLSEADIIFHEIKEDIDDGQHIFEVEFMSPDGTEYDYKLSAKDGSILSYDYDAESQFQKKPSTSAGIIPEDQVKKTVLDRVPGASSKNMVICLEEDDGRMEYEGELFYDNMKYEFKIDAYSGGLMEWEAELVSN